MNWAVQPSHPGSDVKDSRWFKRGFHVFSNDFREPMREGLSFSSLMDSNSFFDGGSRCFQLRGTSPLASSVIKAKTVVMILEVIGCERTPTEARRGSGEIVELHAVLKVVEILDRNVTSLRAKPEHMEMIRWELSAPTGLRHMRVFPR